MPESSMSITSKGATAILLDNTYSVKDELMSTISQSQKNKTLLEKRSKVTSDRLMEQAQDALVFKNSESVLLGGENQKLNEETLMRLDGKRPKQDDDLEPDTES